MEELFFTRFVSLQNQCKTPVFLTNISNIEVISKKNKLLRFWPLDYKSSVWSLYFFFESQDFKHESDVWKNILDRFVYHYKVNKLNRHYSLRPTGYLGNHLALLSLPKDKGTESQRLCDLPRYSHGVLQHLLGWRSLALNSLQGIRGITNINPPRYF